MIETIKKYNYISFVVAFIGLPVLLFSLGDFPSRTFLKDAISLLTILAFSLIIGQFFLSRTNNLTKKIHKYKNVISAHKAIGYFSVTLFLLHPFLIILPRYFESGVDPIDAFVTMLTTFDSLGIILGLIAWGLMLMIGLTSMFRNKLNMSHKAWRVFHGLLSLGFILIATWHSVDLGRHTNISISLFFIIMATAGSSLLIKQYIFSNKKKGSSDV